MALTQMRDTRVDDRRDRRLFRRGLWHVGVEGQTRSAGITEHAVDEMMST